MFLNERCVIYFKPMHSVTYTFYLLAHVNVPHVHTRHTGVIIFIIYYERLVNNLLRRSLRTHTYIHTYIFI